MKKKIVLSLLALCVAASCTAFVACNKDDTTPDTPPAPVTKTDNIVVLNDIADINCGESPVLSATAEDEATITYVFSETENGEYKALPESFIHGEYYIKAVAAETATHNSTTSAAKKFTANEKLSYWDEERSEEYDYGVCECGELIENVTFKKRVEGVQELVVTSAENLKRPNGDGIYSYDEKYLIGKISLGEIGEQAENVGEVTLGEISLGNDITKLDFSGLTDKKLHGEQNLFAEVTDKEGFTHKAVVPVLLITRVVSTDDELNVLLSGDGYRLSYVVNGVDITPKTEDNRNDINYVAGYYKLTNDIVYTAATAGNAFQNAVFDGGNHKITLGTAEKGAPSRGMFSELYNTVIKNVVIDAAYNNPEKSGVTVGTDSDYNTIFANFAFGCTFENVTINYVSGTDSTYAETKGMLVNYDIGATTFKNITINANGKKLGAILCHSDSKIENFVFEDFVINDCSGIGCLVTAVEGKIQPWEVAGVKGAVKNDINSAVVLDPLSEDVISVSLGEAYSSLTDSVKAVTKTAADGTEEDVTEYCNFTAEGLWFYESDIASEADRRGYITLSVEYETENFGVELSIRHYVIGGETYTVTFIQRSGGSDIQIIKEGGKVTFPAHEPAGEGERFLGWKTEDGKIWNENDVVLYDMDLFADYDAVAAEKLFVNATVCDGNIPENYERLYEYADFGENVLFSTADVSKFIKLTFEFEVTNWVLFDSWEGTYFFSGYTKAEINRTGGAEWRITFTGENVQGLGSATLYGNDVKSMFAGTFGTGDAAEETKLVITEIRGVKAYGKATVTYLNDDGTTLKTERTEKGEKLNLPTVSVPDGKYFIGWKTEDGKLWNENGVVTENLVLRATFGEYAGVLVEDAFINGSAAVSETAPEGYESWYSFTATQKGETPQISDTDISGFVRMTFVLRATGFVLHDDWNLFSSDGETFVKITRTGVNKWRVTYTGDNLYKITFNDKVESFTFDREGTNLNEILKLSFYDIGNAVAVTEIRGEKASDTVEVKFVGANGEIIKTETVGFGSKLNFPEVSVPDGKYFIGWKTTDGKVFGENEGVIEDVVLTASFGEYAGVLVDDCAYGINNGVDGSGFSASEIAAPEGFSNAFERKASGEWQTDLSHAAWNEYEELTFAIKTDGMLILEPFGTTDTKYITSDEWMVFVITKTETGWNVKILGTDFDSTRTDVPFENVCGLLYHGVRGLRYYDRNWSGTAEYTVYCTEIRGVKKAD